MARKPTQLQTDLVNKISENIRNPKGKRQTLGKMMRKVGYSKKQSLNPNHIMKSPNIQKPLQELAEILDEKRRMALDFITKKKLQNASGYSLALITDLMTKNHQLISGKATERVEGLSDEERAKIDKLLS